MWRGILAAGGILAAVFLALSCLATQAPVADDGEAPQVRALLAQAWASEAGLGVHRNPLVASALYGQAGKLGSAEGFYRAGRIQLSLGFGPAQLNYAACLFAAASQLGHHEAREALERLNDELPMASLACAEDTGAILQMANFDLDRYVSGLPPPRRKIVALIRQLAPRFGIDPRLALAVATVESNLDPWAVSPKRAMGVMQLIPETAERFNVKRPFDAEQNIRGGLAYLRWLQQYYQGDTVRMVAAYNAGEGAVDRYRGIPPYMETVLYVSRVLGFSGRSLAALPAAAAGASAIVSAK
ncbi:lytic transglycosylase domain-containing protein [Azospira restricta]|uniref:Lytic transglycosylase domain-containing protein n=1 Tax=Azospira restricta TaxID=404405 RepID=A0A974PX33_9RHOO|nr:lytic transglycosylase domain-containing protein [Azospira restricta]QRJ62911.1 lytic transglycosylase domain-containing protein [Azospira restricta]